MRHPPLSRRRFLAAAAASAPLFRGLVLAGEEDARKAPASERLAVGFIGCAGQGDYNLNEISAAGAEVAALCDVDENRAAAARMRFPKAKFFTDYRRLIDEKGLDAVAISTPDHHHAPAALRALGAGLHVYCEKPLAHTVEEVRLLSEAAARAKRVTQMGTQIHAGTNYRRVVELVRSGAIGPVREVHVWCGTSYGGMDRPLEGKPVPAGLHYDLWLGPAPERPFHPDHLHFWWRRWWDFGGGGLADMACHHIDLPFWALDLRRPLSVAAEGSPVHPDSSARWLIARWEFAARGDLPPVRLAWYDGGKRPPHFGPEPPGGVKLPQWGDGTLFVGEKGMLLADYGRHRLLPEEKFQGFAPPAPSIPDSVGHHREWVEACRKGGPTTCEFGYAGALTETVLLGNVSYRLGKPFTWDAAAMRAGEPGAERFLRKEYRKPWSLS